MRRHLLVCSAFALALTVLHLPPALARDEAPAPETLTEADRAYMPEGDGFPDIDSYHHYRLFGVPSPSYDESHISYAEHDWSEAARKDIEGSCSSPPEEGFHSAASTDWPCRIILMA